MLRIFEYVVLTAFIAGLTVASRWIGRQAYTWMPPQATMEAQDVDQLFSFLVSVGAFIFLGLVGMMLYSVLFFRAKPDDYSEGHPARGSIQLEILWTVAPVLLVAWIALQNLNIYNQLNILGLKQIVQLPLETSPAIAATAPTTTPKPATETIQVLAKQWNWSFRYPNGVISAELHLPANESTHLDMEAEKVIHGFYIPEFRLRQDIVPGRDIGLVVTPIRVGQYRLQDAQFSGTYFAAMQADVYVEPREAYDQWLAAATKQPPSESGAIAEQLHPPKTFFTTTWATNLSQPLADSPTPEDDKA